jgi:hypothetical protein
VNVILWQKINGVLMSSDFDKDSLDVDRHYSKNWFTQKTANIFLKHNFKLGYKLVEWLVGYANVLISASPRDGYEWLDRRTLLFSKYDAELQGSLLAELLNEELQTKATKGEL